MISINQIDRGVIVLSSTLALCNSEKTALNNVAAGKTSGYSDQDVQALVGALIKAAPDIFKKVLAIIHDDVKLQKAIVTQFHATALRTININDEMTRKVLDDGNKNSELIRELIKRPNQTFEQTEALLIELRFYFSEMQLAASETQKMNERALQNEHAVVQAASASSRNRRNLAIGITGGVAVGGTVGYILRPFIEALINNTRRKL